MNSELWFAQAVGGLAFLIGITTFFICIAGLILGKTFGMKLADKAIILGGIILIAIGIEIFIG